MFVLPCLPTTSKRPPTGSAWVHEIRHDGYRLIVRRDGDRVRVYTRRGYNWSARFPVICAGREPAQGPPVIIDGEAVVCDANGVPSFDMLHSKGPLSFESGAIGCAGNAMWTSYHVCRWMERKPSARGSITANQIKAIRACRPSEDAPLATAATS